MATREGKETMTSERDEPLTTHWGTLYPKDHVVAVVTDQETVATARAGLEKAGWARDEVETLSGPAFLEQHAAMEEQQNVVERMGAMFASDERLLRDQYVDEAKRGRHFLFIRAETSERAHRAVEVIEPLRPTAVHHFGEHAMTELLPLSTPEAGLPPAERHPDSASQHQKL